MRITAETSGESRYYSKEQYWKRAEAFTYFILHLRSDNARAKSNYRNVLHSHENIACALTQVGAIDKGNSCTFNDTEISTKGHIYVQRRKMTMRRT